ncbi:MAG: hypothetical protein ABI478_15550, partial [Propionivibrio sp.]
QGFAHQSLHYCAFTSQNQIEDLIVRHNAAVIPANAGIQQRTTGFRVKPGVTMFFLSTRLSMTAY